jgi:hypothetical protein
VKFEDFLDYIIIKDKQGKLYPIDKELLLKHNNAITTFLKKEINRTTRKRK